MPLVDYPSDSDEDIPEAKRQKVASSNLPPLPATFRDLYATPVRTSTSDDPSLHGGRQRAIPHVVGNWPTHLYTEWYPSDEHSKAIEQLITFSTPNNHDVRSFLQSELGAALPLHISLSRSLGLQHEQRDVFAAQLKSNLDASGVQPFEVSAIGLSWVSNFNRSRWFLVLQLGRPACDDLNKLLESCNGVAASFGQPKLYVDSGKNKKDQGIFAVQAPGEVGEDSTVLEVFSVNRNKQALGDEQTNNLFHISIAWSLSEPTVQKKPSGDEETLQEIEDLLLSLLVPVEAVKAKVGNNIISFRLQPRGSCAKSV